jgi:hypothetical protein
MRTKRTLPPAAKALKYFRNNGFSFFWIIRKGLLVPTVMTDSSWEKIEKRPKKEDETRNTVGHNCPSKPLYDFTKVVRTGNPFVKSSFRNLITILTL